MRTKPTESILLAFALAGATALPATAAPASRAVSSDRERLAVLAPLLRAEARHARASGFTCIFSELSPALAMSRGRFARDYSGFQREQAWVRITPDEVSGLPAGLARRLDAALRRAATAPARRTRLRIQWVPPPLVLIRNRPAGDCDLTMRNPIGQWIYSEPALADGFAFVEAQGLLWGTNLGPSLHALERTRQGWREVAVQINLVD